MILYLNLNRIKCVVDINLISFVTVIDCVTSDWSDWSKCDVPCGPGTQTRKRKILIAAENGGKHCQSTVQNRGCQGIQCHSHADHTDLRGKFFFPLLRCVRIVFVSLHICTAQRTPK